MVRLQKLPDKNSHFVTIPHQLRKAMGWKKKDELEFKVKSDDELVISSAD